MKKVFRRGYGYKKAGAVVTRIMQADEVVGDFFENSTAKEREQRLTSALNGIYGRGAVKLAVQGSGQIKSASEKQSPHYTTLWSDIPSVIVK